MVFFFIGEVLSGALQYWRLDAKRPYLLSSCKPCGPRSSRTEVDVIVFSTINVVHKDIENFLVLFRYDSLSLQTAITAICLLYARYSICQFQIQALHNVSFLGPAWCEADRRRISVMYDNWQHFERDCFRLQRILVGEPYARSSGLASTGRYWGTLSQFHPRDYPLRSPSLKDAAATNAVRVHAQLNQLL